VHIATSTDADELRPPPIGTDVAISIRNGCFLLGLARSKNKESTPRT